jgi:hypothetical protein
MTPVEWVLLVWAVAVAGYAGQYWVARHECRRAYHQGYRACRRDWDLPPGVAPRVYTAEVIPPEHSHEEYDPGWSEPAEWDEESLSALAAPAPPLELEPAPMPGPVTVEFMRISDETAEQFKSIRARFALRQQQGAGNGPGGPGQA